MIKVAICGKIRSGKDTLAGFFIDEGLTECKFATGIDEIIDKYFPTAKAQGKPRRHYQHIGQQLRVLDNDVWINYTLGHIDMLERFYPSTHAAGFVISDMRQPNEAKRVKENGFVIIKVVADDKERLARMKALGDQFTAADLNHETEQGVDNIEADIIVYNNGSKKDLYLQFLEIWDKLSYNGAFQ